MGVRKIHMDDYHFPEVGSSSMAESDLLIFHGILPKLSGSLPPLYLILIIKAV